MKSIFIIAMIVLASTSSFSQVGKTFPEITGETLDQKTKTLPNDSKGKMTLVGMAYSKKAEEALKSWYQPCYDKFIAKLGIFDSKYDVNLMFIPMYIGLKQAAYEPTMKELRESNRTDLFPYIMFYKGELEPYGSQLNLTDKSSPSFFLIDESGKIIHTVSGFYTEEKMEKIEEFFDF